MARTSRMAGAIAFCSVTGVFCALTLRPLDASTQALAEPTIVTNEPVTRTTSDNTPAQIRTKGTSSWRQPNSGAPNTLDPDGSLARFAETALVPLSPDELEILRVHGEAALPRLIAEAEREFFALPPGAGDSAHEKYVQLLNLAAKFAQPGPAPTAAELAAQTEYLATLDAAMPALEKLPNDERISRMDAIKESIYSKFLNRGDQ